MIRFTRIQYLDQKTFGIILVHEKSCIYGYVRESKMEPSWFQYASYIRGTKERIGVYYDQYDSLICKHTYVFSR